MKVEKCSFNVIIPLEYDEMRFHNYKSHINIIKNTEDTFDDCFQERPVIKTMQMEDSPLFVSDDNCLIRRFELKQSKRQKIGLHKNNSCTYYLEKERIPLQIRSVRLWLIRYGTAFLSLEIHCKDIDENGLLTLSSQLCNIQLKQKITYNLSISKNESIKQTFTFFDLIRQFLGLQNNLTLEICKGETYKRAYCILYGIANADSDDSYGFFLEMLRLQRKSQMRIGHSISEKDYYEPYEYLRWVIGERIIGAFANMELAGVENEDFLKSPGGLGKYISENYHSLFCYYISLHLYLTKLEIECKRVIEENKYNFSQELVEKIMLLKELPIKSLSSISEINYLFENYISESKWNISERISKLHHEYLHSIIDNRACDIFISYRRDGGFYAARLLYELLEKNHKKPFLDIERLGSGLFDEKIYEVMEHCDVVLFILTKGCLDRCIDDTTKEFDWLRIEIKKAISLKKSKGIKIIPILIDEFTFPKIIPYDIDISKENAITFTPRSFAGDFLKLMRFLDD